MERYPAEYRADILSTKEIGNRLADDFAALRLQVSSGENPNPGDWGEERRAKCLQIIEENRQFAGDFPILLELPPAQFARFKVVAYLLNQPNFTYERDNATPALVKTLGLSTEEWTDIQRKLGNYFNIIELVKKEGTERINKSIRLDIDGLIETAKKGRQAFITPGLLKLAQDKLQEKTNLGLSDEEAAEYQNRIDKIVNPDVADERQTDHMESLLQDPRFINEAPIIRNLPPGHQDYFRVIAFLIDQPGFTFKHHNAGSALGKILNFSHEQWDDANTYLNNRVGIVKLLKDGSSKNTRSHAAVLDIDALLYELSTAKIPSKKLPFVTVGLLNALREKLNEAAELPGEAKLSQRLRLDEVIKSRANRVKEPKKPRARRKRIRRKKIEQAVFEIKDPLKDPRFASEIEVLESLSSSQINFFKTVLYLVDQPDFIFCHPNNASGELANRIGFNAKQWGDVRRKLKYSFGIIDFEIKEGTSGLRSRAVKLNISSLLENAMEKSKPFITDGLLKALRDRLSGTSGEDALDYSRRIDEILAARAAEKEGRTKVQKEKKSAMAPSKKVATRKTIRPKQRTTKPAVHSDTRAKEPMPRRELKPKKSIPKKLSFSFPIPGAVSGYRREYSSKEFRSVDAMERLLLAIGHSATFASDLQHQQQYLLIVVNKNLPPEETRSPEQVEGLIRQAEYQGLISISGSIFQLTKVALLKWKSRT